MAKKTTPEESKALKVINYIMDKAINGIPPLCSAQDLADQYLIDASYPDNEERIESLINWETTKNFTTGFITGLGGLITLPVAIPSAIGASWIIQARMSGAIAIIAGKDINEDRVRTFVLLSILGDKVIKDVLKEAGVRVATKLSQKAISRISGKALIEINKKVGFRLITKAGEKGVINLIKFVPVIAGFVTGGFDAFSCRVVGKTAKRLFYPQGTTQKRTQNNKIVIKKNKKKPLKRPKK